jgi:hypothetical protein
VNELAGRLDRVAWAIFFIWVGAALLLEIPWGWFLMGVSAVIFAAQFARWWLKIDIDGFWALCGLVFLASAMWSLFDFHWPLMAILLIVLGLALLGKVLVEIRR